MQQFKSAEEILNFAIAKEQEAHDFYVDLAKNMATPAMSKVFEEFAREEMGHKIKLEQIMAGKRGLPPAKKIMDLKVGDYLVADEPSPGMSYQDALILSVRARSRGDAAERLVQAIVAGEGSAGGHGTMAGGQIPVAGRVPEQLAFSLMRRALRHLGIPPDVDGELLV